jgi:deoxyribose-phosphate aldolase
MQTETPTRQPNLLPQLAHTRNPGMALDLDWVANVQVNTSAVERRTSSLGGRRSVKKEFQAAWLLKAISLIDLTKIGRASCRDRV